MSTAMHKRLSRLEGGSAPREHREALVVIHGAANDPGSMIGVNGINVPRMASESAADFLARLETHVRATRGNALPFIGFAQYPSDTDE
jgi:hypothetical protein